MKNIFLKKILIISLILISTSCAIISVAPEKITPTLIKKRVQQLKIESEYLLDKNNITVITIGTSSPLPGTRAQTGTAIFVNGFFFMFDVGAGVVQKSEKFQLPLDQLHGVFLTHYHSDHIIDLPNLINRSWVLGRTNGLNVYGPDGLNSIMLGIDKLLLMENQYRVEHHGPEILDISKAKAISNEFTISNNGEVVIFQENGVTITAFDVNHEPIEPAVGYVIEYNGKKVVLSGDTKKNSLLEKKAKDADLLIHEVMLMSLQQDIVVGLMEAKMERNAKILTDIQNYHTSPAEVAELATKANVKKLVLNHFAPVPDNIIIRKLYLKELKGFEGPIHLANDGDVFFVK